ncbi:MAG: STAS domain-containing protein [Clostridiales bacterium]|nr:STAS domain-containing protein [Clostridiales bacterium]
MTVIFWRYFMEVKYKIANGVLEIFFFGELDQHSASLCKDALDNLLDSTLFSVAVFDLTSLSFTDSTGIGLLLGRYKKISKMGKSVYIKNAKPNVEKVLTTSGIYSIMPKI